MKEYLVVLFPTERRIKLNGKFMGKTNTKLELEGGSYTVTLGEPKNFTPEEISVDLHNTSVLMPMTVKFSRAV